MTEMKPVSWIEHERIWLAPRGEDERTWCCDNVYEGEGVEYILVSSAQSAIEAERQAAIDRAEVELLKLTEDYAKEVERRAAAEALLKEAGTIIVNLAEIPCVWQDPHNDGLRRAARSLLDKIGERAE